MGNLRNGNGKCYTVSCCNLFGFIFTFSIECCALPSRVTEACSRGLRAGGESLQDRPGTCHLVSIFLAQGLYSHHDQSGI